MEKVRKIPKNIQTFEDLFSFLKIGKYSLQTLQKKVNVKLELHNSGTLYDLFLNELIDYQIYQDLCLYFDTK